MKVMLLLVLHLLDAHTIKANIGSMHTQNNADLLAAFCFGIAELKHRANYVLYPNCRITAARKMHWKFIKVGSRELCKGTSFLRFQSKISPLVL